MKVGEVVPLVQALGWFDKSNMKVATQGYPERGTIHTQKNLYYFLHHEDIFIPQFLFI